MFLVREGTKVLLASGEEIPIGDLELGMLLQGKQGVNKVKGIRREASKGVTFSTGDLRSFSPTQLIHTRAGWACVAHGLGAQEYPGLSINQLNDKQQLDTLEDVSLEEEIETEENEKIEVELDGDHTYIVNGHLVHNKGGSSAPAQQTTIQKTEPPAYLQPFLTDIARQAQDAFREVPQGGFQGDLVAPVDPRQREALSSQESIARGLGSFGANTQEVANQQFDRILSGDILDPVNERFTPQSADTAGVISAALDPVQQRLQEQILPGIASDAISAGAFGGTRQDTLENRALREFSREAGNIAANINYADFARTEDQRFNDLLSIREFAPELEKINQAAILTAPELQNQALQQSLLPSNLLGEVGEANRLLGQDAIDNAYQQYVLSTQTPFAGLDQYASIVAGTPFGQTSTLTGPRSAGGGVGGFGSALGGGLAGAQLGSMLFPGVGTAVGGLGGAILGGLFG